MLLFFFKTIVELPSFYSEGVRRLTEVLVASSKIELQLKKLKSKCKHVLFQSFCKTVTRKRYAELTVELFNIWDIKNMNNSLFVLHHSTNNLLPLL